MINKKLMIGLVSLVAGGASLMAADDGKIYTWNPTRANGTWYTVGNWTTTETAVSANGNYTIAGRNDVVVTTGTNLANGWNFHRLTIGANTTGVVIAPNTNQSFVLGGDPYLLMKEGGITVETGATATINNRVIVNGSVDPSVTMAFDIQGTGLLTLNNYVYVGTRSLVKTGTGTLVLNVSGGTVGSSTAQTPPLSRSPLFDFREGVVELGSGYTLDYSADVATPPGNPLPVHIGSASTTATLRGGGSLSVRSVATTFGSSHSVIDMTHGALKIANMDAKAGVTFRFDLDVLYTLTGIDTLKLGEDTVFELSGGEVGGVYTLLDYDALTVDPLDFASWTLTPGYELDSDFGNGGWLLTGSGDLQFKLAAIPEPSVVFTLLAGCATLAWVRCRSARRAA